MANLTTILNRAIGRFQTVGGVMAFVAGMTTLAVCYGSVMGKSINPVLEHGWSVVLGFYFGAAVERKMTHKPDSKEHQR